MMLNSHAGPTMDPISLVAFLLNTYVHAPEQVPETISVNLPGIDMDKSKDQSGHTSARMAENLLLMCTPVSYSLHTMPCLLSSSHASQSCAAYVFCSCRTISHSSLAAQL